MRTVPDTMREDEIFKEIIDSGRTRGMPADSEINDAFLTGSLCCDESEDPQDFLDDGQVPVTDSEETTDVEEELAGQEKQGVDEKTEDLVQAYFHSMGDITILTKDEEIELAKKLENGKEDLKAAVMALPLTKDGQAENNSIESETGMTLDMARKNHEIITKITELVTKTKHELIIHNLRLVVSIAKHHTGKGLSLLDLIQEGNIGLIKAIDKFDYKRGFKFSTYASWWIRHKIIRALMDQVKTIRLPVHITELYRRIVKVSRELMQQLGREPGTEEIAAKLGVPGKKVAEVLGAMQDPITFQAPIGEDDLTLEDLIGDDAALSPYLNTEKNMLTEQIVKVLHSLSPKEETVVKMRFGIENERNHTLEEVGIHLSLTRERVRQIEAMAMRKLKHHKRLKTLKLLDTA